MLYPNKEEREIRKEEIQKQIEELKDEKDWIEDKLDKLNFELGILQDLDVLEGGEFK